MEKPYANRWSCRGVETKIWCLIVLRLGWFEGVLTIFHGSWMWVYKLLIDQGKRAQPIFYAMEATYSASWWGLNFLFLLYNDPTICGHGYRWMSVSLKNK